jgi:spermidine/putrescine transport system permease protein
MAAALLIFIPTLGDYVTPQLVGGPSGAMIGTYIATQFGPSNNWPLGSAVSLTAMLAATAAACLFLAGSNRLVRLIR